MIVVSYDSGNRELLKGPIKGSIQAPGSPYVPLNAPAAAAGTRTREKSERERERRKIQKEKENGKRRDRWGLACAKHRRREGQ